MSTPHIIPDDGPEREAHMREHERKHAEIQQLLQNVTERLIEIVDCDGLAMEVAEGLERWAANGKAFFLFKAMRTQMSASGGNPEDMVRQINADEPLTAEQSENLRRLFGMS